MKALWDFVEGFTSGCASAMSARTKECSGYRLIESCCQQLGWTIDERLDAEQVLLYFNDSLVGQRNVLITFSDEGVFISFSVFSSADLAPRQTPNALLGYLLERSNVPFVHWRMFDKDESVGFGLTYQALAAGLTPAVFGLICETMIREAHMFDERLSEAGLL